MPSHVNGIGTIYYGASDRQPDRSFVTTEWFTLLYVPLIPLHSWRVRYRGETRQGTRTTNLYDIVAQVPLHRRHILEAYAWLFIPLALIISIASLGSSLPPDAVATIFMGGVFVGIAFWVFIFPCRYKAK